MIEQHPRDIANGCTQSKSSKSFVEHLFQSDSLSCAFETTRFDSHEKSDPILSDLGTLAINSV